MANLMFADAECPNCGWKGKIKGAENDMKFIEEYIRFCMERDRRAAHEVSEP